MEGEGGKERGRQGGRVAEAVTGTDRDRQPASSSHVEQIYIFCQPVVMYVSQRSIHYAPHALHICVDSSQPQTGML